MIAIFFFLAEFTISKIENPFLHLFSFQNFNLTINFHNTILSNPCGLTISQSSFQRKLEIHKLEAKSSFSTFLFFNPSTNLILKLSSSKFHHFLAPVIKSVSDYIYDSTNIIQDTTFTNQNISNWVVNGKVFKEKPNIQVISCIFENINSENSPNQLGGCIHLELPSGKTGSIYIAYTQFNDCSCKNLTASHTYGGAIYIKLHSGSELSVSFEHVIFDKCDAYKGSSYYIVSEDKQIQIHFTDINITNNFDKPMFQVGTAISYLENCKLNLFSFMLYTNTQSNNFQIYSIILVNCDGKLNNIQFTDIHPSSAESAMISYQGTNKNNHHICFQNIGCFNIGELGYALQLEQLEPNAILTCEVSNVWGRGEYYVRNQPITYIGAVGESPTEGMNIQLPTEFFSQSEEFSESCEFSNSITFSSSALFTKTVQFTKSIAFTKSIPFTQSLDTSELSSSDLSEDASERSPGDGSNSSSKDAGMIAGITIAVIVVLIIIALIIAFLCLRKPMCCIKPAFQQSEDDESVRELFFFSNNK